MIVNGVALEEYLKKYNVGKREFVDSLNTGDVTFNRIELDDLDDDGLDNAHYHDFIQHYDDHICESELFKKGARLGFEASRKFINLIGAYHAKKLIDWEAMGIAEPRFI